MTNELNKSRNFNTQEELVAHDDAARQKLEEWLSHSFVDGLSVLRDKQGDVASIRFTKTKENRFTQSTPTAADIEKDKQGRKETDKIAKEVMAKRVGKEKKGGCSSCAKKGLLGLIKGSAKLLKSELGIDAADEETMADRKALCLGCPIYDFGVCVEEKGGCGCFVAAKVKLKSEACPMDKWKAVN